MKNYLTLICALVFCFSCTKDKTTIETSTTKAQGTLINDSIIKPEVLPFETGPKVPKETYIASQKSFSLDPVYGKDVISSITPKDGLPPSRFNTFNRDSKGNIWLSDFRSQILKYDGQNFKDYGSLDSQWYNYQLALGLNDELWLNRFKPSSEGFIWQTLVYDGINFKEIKELTVLNKSENFIGVVIFKGYDGAIWHINVIDHIISHYKGQELIASYTKEDFKFDVIRSVQDFGDEGALFFDSRADKLVKLLNGEFQEIPIQILIPESNITDIKVITPNTYYVSTSTGIYFIKDGETTLINKDDLSIEIVDANNRLWVESDEGLVKFNDSLRITVLPKSELNKLGRTAFYMDDMDNIWLNGQSFLGRFNNTLKTYANLIENKPEDVNNNLGDILQAKNGDYFFGTRRSGLLHFDGTALINYNFLKQSAKTIGNDNFTRDVIEDANGTIWFVQGMNILKKFDGEFFHSYNISNKSNFIGLEHIDSKGRLWLVEQVGRGGGANTNLLLFNGDSLQKITSSSLLGDFLLSCIYEDESGTIWIGTSQGLYRYTDKELRKYTVKDGLSNNYINVISEDKDGSLWIGTTGGLSIFSNKSFINYGKADGLLDTNISSIIKDDHNNKFWLRSGGSERFMVVNQDAGDSKTLLVENYSAAEGFPIPSGSDFTVDDKGIAWLTTNDNSLFRFDYPALKEKSKAFPVYLNTIRLNGESVVWSQLSDNYAKDSLIARTEMSSRFGLQKTAQELDRLRKTFSSVSYDSLVSYEYIPLGLKLPFEANSLSFEFSATDPFLAKSTKYQYFLDGFDKAWSPLDKINIANYGNLNEGDYTLKIKALNPYGLWSETSYTFTVLPPWYRTWWAYGIYGLLLIILLRRVHTYQKQRTVKKEREKAQKRELEQAKEIEKAYNELKATQEQLIQSEKMASLGELTAGIAHEIQNPLNFVNNFSEVSSELIDEMKEELDNGDIEEAKSISDDIKQNLEKITYHGKRADSIVKGMLQHSRNNSGEKELVDLNKLTDEYMRLAYHGLRAKDKSFNATLETHFDDSIGEVEIVPQDLGRVILNLFTNAFYVVDEKKKATNDSNYKPTVSVITKKDKDSVIIKVKDNGSGISNSAIKKIFEPFFTTKPTGKGTGLGLSMSYDIIKAHGGTLEVTTKEDEFTTFTIKLPLNLKHKKQ
jgi:signal transduction histidine kinase/ligand-binding sensor domain-containing protein